MENREIKKLAEQYIKFEKNKEFSDEVSKLLSDENYSELGDRFYTELDFGTGGIRGVIGGGYNRINPFIIKKTTQGLANYINKAVSSSGSGEKRGSVAIAYDSRRFSPLFAKEAALVLCANNIKVYLFTSLRPTPQLSFAVRELGCTAGIVITASHNPAEYNGYKVSWSDGGQVVEPHDRLIIDEVRKSSGENIREMREKDAVDKKLLQYIDREIDEPYLDMVKGCYLRPDLVREKGKTLKIVYTPLHGAGRIPVEKALKDAGIDVITVPEQAEPDGEFPTVKYPNPEEASAMALALKLAGEVDADLVMGTDPDSDRIGIAVPDRDDGKGFTLINGNQLGSMLAYYILSTLKAQGRMPDKPAIIKTIVTTELQRLIGESFGVTVYDVLTGFKWIADLIAGFEKTGENYVFGGEESYGFLVGTRVRDKDAVSAAVVTAEMTLFGRENGMSVLDFLNSIYEKYGYFRESQVSGTFKGQSGLKIMKNLMSSMRGTPPSDFDGIKVIETRDYKNRIIINNITLPEADVLQFILEERSMITVRPSGTEPKIKFYISCREKPGKKLEQAKSDAADKAAAMEKDIKKIIDSANQGDS
ncbi:MAG: phospho-sugar mutase [Spirochaetia bacterium]|jgi:phosphoglucomutase|nr:phospho-sugar mutase [Spirochaetia bacterium]